MNSRAIILSRRFEKLRSVNEELYKGGEGQNKRNKSKSRTGIEDKRIHFSRAVSIKQKTLEY